MRDPLTPSGRGETACGEGTEALFSYLGVEARAPSDHPLRHIRVLANEALAAMAGALSALCAVLRRLSIAPKELLRAMLLQGFYPIRYGGQLMPRPESNLVFR